VRAGGIQLCGTSSTCKNSIWPFGAFFMHALRHVLTEEEEVQVLRGAVNAYNTTNLWLEIGRLGLRRAPHFLGDFKYQMYKGCPMGHQTNRVVSYLRTLVPNQSFNTVFIQSYEPGQCVKPHRDPRNNVGQTVIGLFGDNWETLLSVDSEETQFRQFPGDVFILPCTIDGVQGPRHAVNWAINSGNGIRHAIILNTII
jgi:hypothetical protein